MAMVVKTMTAIVRVLISDVARYYCYYYDDDDDDHNDDDDEMSCPIRISSTHARVCDCVYVCVRVCVFVCVCVCVCDADCVCLVHCPWIGL